LIGQTDGSSGFTTGVNGDLAGTSAGPLDPKLGPLTNNGGSTLTMALLAGSPAIEAGDDSVLGAPFSIATDQRGFPRRIGVHVDIGAFESAGSLYISRLNRLANGASQIIFNQTPGASFTVLTATNVSLPLSNWTVLGVATEIAPGQFQFNDPQATNSAQRFYRLRSP